MLTCDGLPVDEGPFHSIWEDPTVKWASEKLAEADENATNAARNFRVLGSNPYNDLKIYPSLDEIVKFKFLLAAHLANIQQEMNVPGEDGN